MKADVLVISVERLGEPSYAGRRPPASLVEVVAVPFDSWNLVKRLVFVQKSDEAPRVGAVLRVTVEEVTDGA